MPPEGVIAWIVTLIVAAPPTCINDPIPPEMCHFGRCPPPSLKLGLPPTNPPSPKAFALVSRHPPPLVPPLCSPCNPFMEGS